MHIKGALLVKKTLFGKEQLGGVLVALVGIAHVFLWETAPDAQWLLVALLCGLVCARYPDLDFTGALVRRELIRQNTVFGRFPVWVAGKAVTAVCAGLIIAGLTLAPHSMLYMFGAPLPALYVVAMCVGSVLVATRAWQYHELRHGIHWLYGGHCPPLIMLAVGMLGYQLGVFFGEPVVLALVCAGATLWHFWCDDSLPTLGFPWFSPFSPAHFHFRHRKRVSEESVAAQFSDEMRDFQTYIKKSAVWWLFFCAANEGVEKKAA